MMDRVSFVLPAPPPVSKCYTRDCKPTSRLRSWRNTAGWDVPKVSFGEGPVRITIDVRARRNADLDNNWKAILDLLVIQGVIADDNSYVVRDERAIATMRKPKTVGIHIERIEDTWQHISGPVASVIDGLVRAYQDAAE